MAFDRSKFDGWSREEIIDAYNEVEEVAVVECERWAPLRNWKDLAEIRPAPIHSGLSVAEPVIIVRQHRDTRELRIDVFGCEDGIDVTPVNGGVEEKYRDRAKWFRDFRTCRKSIRALTIRVMCQGDGDNIRLKS